MSVFKILKLYILFQVDVSCKSKQVYISTLNDEIQVKIVLDIVEEVHH